MKRLPPCRSQRSLLHLAPLAALGALAHGCGEVEPSEPPAPAVEQAAASAVASAPNIITIMLDDLDEASLTDLLANRGRLDAAHAVGWIPNIASLIAGGTRFTNSFVVNAVCCPSRASYLSGQYVQNHGVRTVAKGISYWMTGDAAGGEQETIATWLQRAGYYTGHLGKYLNGYGYFTPRTYVPPGYHDWQALLDPGTYRVYNYSINDNGAVVTYGADEDDYQTDVLRKRAKQFLQDHAAGAQAERPFYLTLTPIAPHIEVIPTDAPMDDYRHHFYELIRPAPRHLHLVDGDDANGEVPSYIDKASFNEDNADKLAWFRALPAIDDATRAARDLQYKHRLASILAVDELIGEVMATLGSLGKLDQTLIVFTADNGYHFGEHRLSSKLVAFDESIRVPLAIRGPGITAGATSTRPVLNIDLAPTYVALSGAAAGRVVDGRSLIPLLQSPAASWSREQFLVDHYDENMDSVLEVDLSPPTYKAVRRLSGAEDRIYVSWRERFEQFPDLVTYREHYDLAADPLQLTNTAGHLTVPQRLAFDNLIRSFEACAGQGCRGLEAAP
jgi:arylsulfatase A-like enzyme